jgi:hypothetical protein
MLYALRSKKLKKPIITSSVGHNTSFDSEQRGQSEPVPREFALPISQAEERCGDRNALDGIHTK